VLAGLRQPATIEKALSSVSPEARRLFGRIVELTSVDRFGFTDSDEAPGSVPLDSLMNANTVQYRAASRDLLSLYAPVRGNMTPLGELVEALLITASMGWGDSVTLFMEVAHGCGKALGPALVPPPDVVGVPVQETPMAPPAWWPSWATWWATWATIRSRARSRATVGRRWPPGAAPPKRPASTRTSGCCSGAWPPTWA
jgi:hypothetical protein